MPDAVKGVRYELEGAAALIRQGKNVTKVTKRVRSGKQIVTDVDVVVRDQASGKDIYYQFKVSRNAFGSFKKTKAWVRRAKKDLGDEATYDQIKYVVPNISEVPPLKVLPWLRGRQPPIEIIDNIPLTP